MLRRDDSVEGDAWDGEYGGRDGQAKESSPDRRMRALETSPSCVAALDPTTAKGFGEIGGGGRGFSARGLETESNTSRAERRAYISNADKTFPFLISIPSHKTKDRRSRIKRYCSDITVDHVATSNTDTLVHLLTDLRTLEQQIRPEDGGWAVATRTEHTSLRHIWTAMLRVMEELRNRDALGGLVQQADFNKILSSLVVFSPQTGQRANNRDQIGSTMIPEDNEPDSDVWRKLGLPQILRFMATIGISPSAYHLEMITASRSTRLLRPTDHAQHYRSRLALTHTHLGSTALRLWSDRRKIVQSTLAMHPEFEGTELYEREILQSMDEVDILTLGRYADDVVDDLREGMDFWIEHRDRLVQRKIRALQDYVRRWKDLGNEDHFVTIRPQLQETKDLSMLLRDSLLSRRIQPAAVNRWSGESPNLSDPFDLLKLLLGATTSHRTPKQHPQARFVMSAIIRMRNAFYLNHDTDSLRKLIRLITPPKTMYPMDDIAHVVYSKRVVPAALPSPAIRLLPPPPLHSAIHSTLMCAAHTPWSIRHILVRTSHLESPINPLQLGKKTRQYLRNLASRADERDWTVLRPNHPDSYFTEQRDTVARAIVDKSGWTGLLEHLFEKWGEGLTLKQWDKLKDGDGRVRITGKTVLQEGDGSAQVDGEGNADGEGNGQAMAVRAIKATVPKAVRAGQTVSSLQARLREIDLVRSVTRPKNILERPVKKALQASQAK